jgi:hypothetical protein
MKLYVRVLRRVKGGYKKVYNKTFDVEEYVDFLEMMAGIRKALWRMYMSKKGDIIVYSKGLEQKGLKELNPAEKTYETA